MMRTPAVVLVLALAGRASVHAQSLSERVAAVREGAVMFHFAPRAGVCGDGAHFIRFGHSYMGEYRKDYVSSECYAGPVVVRISKMNGEIDRVEAWVGPVRNQEGRDLGVISASSAAKYLMDVARTVPGRAATKAILPAVLADSAVIWPALLEIARDTRTRDRSTRQDAAFWLSRFAAGAIAGKPNQILDDEDRTGEEDLKTHAVFVVSQLPHSEGVPMLLDAARTTRNLSVRTAALFWLGQTGDARALDLFETLLRK